MKNISFIAIALVFMIGRGHAQITFSVTVTDPTMCTNGNCDGMGVITNVSGGTPPYTYTWILPFIHQYNDTGLYICPGTWQVTVSDANSTFAQQNVTFVCNTANGVNSISAEENINVFPSLALNEINIEINSVQGNTGLVIRNILGSVFYSEILAVNGHLFKQVDISALPAGIYSVEFKNREKTVNRKFVKE